ncbi:hypothetical protein RDM66_03670 [Stenotrophomonas maltophilia]|uniref:hypothetical protein n=1 Tax=Stenotrophomonas TaxID=40323 RepID=UPI00165566C5|nr:MULTISPECIES: hypothetical protein [Stenotrophomonas]MBC8774802.1 hypothetical protein [Stenotrophomonas maltophilia]WMR42883.1 hypothetical protein RDM66_03670 [Stenotrophomonas maltophilia]
MIDAYEEGAGNGPFFNGRFPVFEGRTMKPLRRLAISHFFVSDRHTRVYTPKSLRGNGLGVIFQKN